MYEQYVNDLVATGYYVLLAHEDDDLSERWRLGCAGDRELETFRIWRSDNADAFIVVDLLYKDGRVYYSEDIATTNLEKAAIASGLLDGNRYDDGGASWDDDETGTTCHRCHCSGESQCTTCWGSGQVSSAGTLSRRETCDDCRSRDTCDFCNGTGVIN